jgi:phytoene dehydrogenase-like protein
MPLKSPVTIAGVRISRLPVEFLGHDPTMAPEGKTVLRLMLDTDHEYWKQASGDPVRYAAEKEAVAATVVDALSEKYPGFAQQVEMRDVATPLTFERYTGNWRGNWGGWRITERTVAPLHMRKTLPGLDHFYMVGQWVEPGGGVPTAALSGRQAVQIMCHRDGKTFNTSMPQPEEDR